MPRISFYTNIFLGLAVCSILCFFSFYRLSESPPTWYDEGMIMQLAENIVSHGVMGFQIAPSVFVSASHESTAFPVIIPVAVSFAVFGVGVLEARVVAIIFLFVCIGASMLLVRKLYGTREALLAGLFLVTFSSLYGNGKNILGEIPGLAFLIIGLFFFEKLRSVDYKNATYVFLAGVFIGLAVVTKPIFLLIAPAFILALLYYRSRIHFRVLPIVLFFLSGLVPVVMWLLTQFAPTDSFRDVLAFYANPYHLQHIPSVMAINVKRFLTEATPCYTLLTFLIWFGSLVVRKIKKEEISFAELCLFLFASLVLFSYLRTPGWYRYLFPANIVIFIFLPYACTRLVLQVTSWFGGVLPNLVSRFGGYVLIGVFLLFQFYHLLFGSWIIGASSGKATELLTQYLASLKAEKSVYVFDTPEVVPFLKTTNYYQYFSADGVWISGEQYLPVLEGGIPDIVIFDSTRRVSALPYLSHYVELDKIDKYVILERK